MAELLRLKSRIKEFPKRYADRSRQSEENRETENKAAIRIQSWFRACKVRAYISHLHKKAIIIQKMWRGFTARTHFRQMVKAAYFIMKINFYEEMAVRIQRRWRGFFVRKYVNNFYARKRYLEGLAEKNELVRRELDEVKELQRRERDYLLMLKDQTAKVLEAHRLHHLLSTQQCPGVFNSPFRPAPNEMEQLLRQVKYRAPTRVASRDRACLSALHSLGAPRSSGTLGFPRVKTIKSCSSPKPILPAIDSKKPQGLFGELREVLEQRVHSPDLTLHLQTTHTYLEEDQNQIRQHEQTGSMLHCLRPSSNPVTQPAETKSFT